MLRSRPKLLVQVVVPQSFPTYASDVALARSAMLVAFIIYKNRHHPPMEPARWVGDIDNMSSAGGDMYIFAMLPSKQWTNHLQRENPYTVRQPHYH